MRSPRENVASHTLTHLRDVTPNAASERHTQGLVDTDNGLVVTRGEGEGEVTKGNRVKYMETEAETTSVASTQYAGGVLLNCALETYMILSTNVTPINIFKIRHSAKSSPWVLLIFVRNRPAGDRPRFKGSFVQTGYKRNSGSVC